MNDLLHHHRCTTQSSKKERQVARKLSAKHRKQAVNGPNQQAMRPAKNGYYNDGSYDLRPVLRWIKSQVGRNWDEILLDIRQGIYAYAQQGSGLPWQIEYEIAQHVRIIKGQPQRKLSYGRDNYRPVRNNEFYVHPASRQLCVYRAPVAGPTTSRSKRQRQKAAEKRKRQFGVAKPDNTYRYPQVKTYLQCLRNRQFYDVSLRRRNRIIFSRIQITRLERSKDGWTYIDARLIKGSTQPLLEENPDGPTYFRIHLDPDPKKNSRYGHDNQWEVYDVGEFTF